MKKSINVNKIIRRSVFDTSKYENSWCRYSFIKTSVAITYLAQILSSNYLFNSSSNYDEDKLHSNWPIMLQCRYKNYEYYFTVKEDIEKISPTVLIELLSSGSWASYATPY